MNHTHAINTARRSSPAIKKISLVLAGMLFAAPVFLSAQSDSDGVLDQARKKYDAVLAADAQTATSGGSTADSDDAQEGSGKGSASAAGVNVDVDVHVTVGKKNRAGNQDRNEDAVDDPESGETESSPERDFQFVGLQLFPSDEFAEYDVGFAAALVISRVGGVRGFQFGFVGAIADDVVGSQNGLIFAISQGDVTFSQAAGVFTIAEGTVNGVQMAGIFNKAGTVNGVQWAGVFNTAETVNGAQLGILNIGGKVRGVQLGIVNIADEIDGVAIGLVNVSKNGLNEQLAWYGNGYGYGGLLMGTQGWFLLGYMGGKLNDIGINTDSLTGGLNFGYRFGKDGPFFQIDSGVKARFSVEVDKTESAYTSGRNVSVNAQGFPNLRLSGGWNFWGPFSIYSGINADFSSKSYWTMPGDYATGWEIPFGDEFAAHLSWFVGLSL